MPPLVSIITPTYNHERFIEACIQSVQQQSYPFWEMLVINDGSTDRTAELVHHIERNDQRVRLFDRTNVGINRLHETYNFALDQAKGDYIAILEGDDFWVSNKLELQMDAMLKHPDCILCWSRATSVIEDRPEVYEIHPKSEDKNKIYYNNDPIGSFFNIVFDDFPAPLTFIIRKSALLAIGKFKQTLPFPAVDLPTILELSLQGPFLFLPVVLGSWRQHANQTTKNNSVQLLEGSMKIILAHYEKLSPQVKTNIRFDLAFIYRNFDARKVVSYSRSGRFKLIKGEFKQARTEYKKSILSGGVLTMPSWKVRSMIGLCLSYFHMDVEGLARLLGKKSFK